MTRRERGREERKFSTAALPRSFVHAAFASETLTIAASTHVVGVTTASPSHVSTTPPLQHSTRHSIVAQICVQRAPTVSVSISWRFFPLPGSRSGSSTISLQSRRTQYIRRVKNSALTLMCRGTKISKCRSSTVCTLTVDISIYLYY